MPRALLVSVWRTCYAKIDLWATEINGKGYRELKGNTCEVGIQSPEEKAATL